MPIPILILLAGILALNGCQTHQKAESQEIPTLLRSQAFSEVEGTKGSVFLIPVEETPSTGTRLRNQKLQGYLHNRGFPSKPPSQADYFLVVGEQETIGTSQKAMVQGSLVLRAFKREDVYQYTRKGLLQSQLPAAWEVTLSYSSPLSLTLNRFYPYLGMRLAQLAGKSQVLKQERLYAEQVQALVEQIPKDRQLTPQSRPLPDGQ